jgi:hypothetical protein
MGESSPVKTRLSLTNSGICPSTIVHCSAQVEQHRACSGQHSTMTPSSNPYLPPPVVRGPSSRAAPSSSPAGRGRVIPPPQGCSHTLERELAFFLGITRPTPALSLTRCHPQLPRERTSFTYPPSSHSPCAPRPARTTFAPSAPTWNASPPTTVAGRRWTASNRQTPRLLLRGAVPQSIHTATDASLAIYLQKRLVAEEDIHLDLVVSIQH